MYYYTFTSYLCWANVTPCCLCTKYLWGKCNTKQAAMQDLSALQSSISSATTAITQFLVNP